MGDDGKQTWAEAFRRECNEFRMASRKYPILSALILFGVITYAYFQFYLIPASERAISILDGQVRGLEYELHKTEERWELLQAEYVKLRRSIASGEAQTAAAPAAVPHHLAGGTSGSHQPSIFIRSIGRTAPEGFSWIPWQFWRFDSEVVRIAEVGLLSRRYEFIDLRVADFLRLIKTGSLSEFANNAESVTYGDNTDDGSLLLIMFHIDQVSHCFFFWNPDSNLSGGSMGSILQQLSEEVRTKGQTL